MGERSAVKAELEREGGGKGGGRKDVEERGEWFAGREGGREYA